MPAGNRAPFPNNQIPLSLFSPVGSEICLPIRALYPLPVSSRPSGSTNRLPSSSYVKSDQGDFKLDYKIYRQGRFFGRYSNGRQDTPDINSFPFIYNSFNIAPFQNGVINWTRTITRRW